MNMRVIALLGFLCVGTQVTQGVFVGPLISFVTTTTPVALAMHWSAQQKVAQCERDLVVLVGKIEQAASSDQKEILLLELLKSKQLLHRAQALDRFSQVIIGADVVAAAIVVCSVWK